MKRIKVALAICCLLVGFSAPATMTTAVLGNEPQVAQAITQESDVAKLVVEGPSRVDIGDLVVISVEGSHAESFKWIVMPSTDNYLVIDEGRRIVFSSGVGGEFVFIVACGLGDTCDLAVHKLTVSGEPAKPATGLSSKIASWCDQVQSDNKRDECLALAQSFSSVALVMEGGTLTTPVDIVKATYRSNQDALGSSLEAWRPFRNGLADELSKMSQAGELSDTASHIKVWKEVANELREYASKL